MFKRLAGSNRCKKESRQIYKSRADETGKQKGKKFFWKVGKVFFATAMPLPSAAEADPRR